MTTGSASTHINPHIKDVWKIQKTFPYNAIDSVQNCHETKKCKDFFSNTKQSLSISNLLTRAASCQLSTRKSTYDFIGK